MKKQVAYLQKLFYELWNDFGSVYVIVKYSDRTIIGRRGFTDEEKQKGLVLVFNSRTNTKLAWDEEGNVSCILAFGDRKEDVSIHHDDLVAVFSPEARVQFLRSDIPNEAAESGGPEPDASGSDAPDGQHVVSLTSFRKQRSKGPSGKT